MMYTVKQIDEDLDFGCEERLDDAPVMALVTLVDSSGKEVTVKADPHLQFPVPVLRFFQQNSLLAARYKNT